MIDKTNAERLAKAANALRPDWPTNSLMTLLAELRDWPLRDLATALAWVATDQDADGNHISQTPARIREDGPWRQHLDDAAVLAAARQRAREDLTERKRGIRDRQLTVAQCSICDHTGRLPTGGLCQHDVTPDERAIRAKARADHARKQVRPMRQAGQIAKELLTEPT